MAVRFVLFDFDGVLLDTEKLHQMTRKNIARDLFGGEYEVDINTLIGGSALDSYAALLKYFGREGDPAALTHLHYASLADYCCEHCAVASEDLLTLLDGLDARGIGYGICSSSPYFYVEQIVEKMGLADRFRFYCGGDEVAHLKPAPDLYLLGVERSGCAREEVIAIEDSRTGLAAAVAAGLPCLGYDYPENEQDLSASVRIITNLSDMLCFIDGQG